MTEVTIELDGEVERAFERVVEHSEGPDGNPATPEDVAESMVVEGTSRRYQQILQNNL